MNIHVAILFGNPSLRSRIIEFLTASVASRFAESVSLTFEGDTESKPSSPVGLLAFISPTSDFERTYDRLRIDYNPTRTLVILPKMAEVNVPMRGRLDNPHIDLAVYGGSIIETCVTRFITNLFADLVPKPTAV